MYKEKRLETILDMVDKEGHVKVNDLTDMFHVSAMTIRRDLRELEIQGYLKKIYGGAYTTANVPLKNINSIYSRMKSSAEVKQRIANAIAKMIGPGEMVFLGSGTTTTFIAKALAYRSDITVVTNALTVVEELATNASMTVIAIGGFLRRNEYSFYGHFSETILKDLRVDKVIMGMRGIHPLYGLTSDFPQELQTDRLIMNTSKSVIIAADRTKIGYVATSIVAPLTAAERIVTSKGANPEILKQIQAQDVKITVV
ncbi:MAG: DeoR/GlpR family DNA-binding transcription regulator [Anaerolineaceae bacterium]